MKTLVDQIVIYSQLCRISDNIDERRKYSAFRSHYLVKAPIVKRAFDTRRINQNTEFNPRRNLQYYQRSEAFIDDETENKVQLFIKVKAATDELRQQFIGEPDWLDSYTRILCNAVDQTLRVDQKDFDYSPTQLDYLSELLYVRYRLRPEDIISASTLELKDKFLHKDEKLLRRGVFVNYQDGLNKQSQSEPSFVKTSPAPAVVVQNDGLIDKLFGNVKASKENKEVQRSVTITISDKVVEPEVVKTVDETDIKNQE